MMKWLKRRRIPVVELHGTLSGKGLSLKSCGPALDEAFRAAGRHRVVILDIDSPGGSPVQSDLIARRIRHLAGKHDVRVIAIIQEVGASGGYWLACAADEIRATPMSIVGSIGVVGGGFGFVDLLHRAGLERRLYTSGANKARLDPFSPERPEDVAFVKALMGDIHERFIAWVRERRSNLPAGAPVFDGSFFLGEKAQALWLIDQLSTLDELLREIGGDRARPRIYRPKQRRNLRRMLAGTLVATVESALGELRDAPALPQLR